MRLRADTLRRCEYAVLIVSGGGNRPGVCSWMERPGALSDGAVDTRESRSALIITSVNNHNTAARPALISHCTIIMRNVSSYERVVCDDN